MADTQVSLIGAYAMECLQTALNANPNPPANYCYRVEYEPPMEVDWFVDQCCEGLGYVAIGEVWPSRASFPENDLVGQTQGDCPFPAWGVQVRMGVMRCVPTLTDEGSPACTEQTAAYSQDLHDSQALREASCCFRNRWIRSTEGLGMLTVVNRQFKLIQGGCKDRWVGVDTQMMNCDC